MRLRVYLAIAVIVFFTATMGADLHARTTIGGEPFDVALRDHVYWAGVQFVATILLFAPFGTIAFVCARLEKQARSRSVMNIFALAMLTLLYFYFQAHQGAQHALKEERWTAATLSIGLLPILIGLPVVLAAVGAGVLATKFDRPMSG